MNFDQFLKNLESASLATVRQAQILIIDQLHDQVRYKIRSERELLDARDAAQRLWSEGNIPIWADMHVVATCDEFTTLGIGFSNNRTDSDVRLRYKETRFPPFQAGTVLMPPGRYVKDSGKIKLI